MTNKIYLEKRSERGISIAKFYELRRILDYIIEDLGCENPIIYIDELRDEAEIYVNEKCRQEIERVFSQLLKDLYEKEKIMFWRAERLSFTKRSDKILSSLHIIRYEEIFDKIYEEILKDLRELFIRYISVSDYLNKEFLMILLSDGSWIVLEGDERSITIPKIESLIAMFHTHPKNICIPSRKDLESILEFLSEGGVVAGVISSTCVFITRLKNNYLSEDEYIFLQDYVNNYEDFLRNIVDEKCCGKLYESENLVLEIIFL